MANISASSSARSGRMDSARHLKRRCACPCLSRGIPSIIRSYVPSKVVGISSKAWWIADGKQRRRAASWQTTQRNLYYHVRTIMTWLSSDDLHPISILRERPDNRFLVLSLPSPHL